MRPLLAILFSSLLILSACSAEPETIIETVVVEYTREVPVTVEVTRRVESTIEVIQEIEVTRELPVEVTRLVEIVVTATPEPTPEPTLEPTAALAPDTGPSAAATSVPPQDIDLTSILFDATHQVTEQCGVITDMFRNVCTQGSFNSSGTAPIQCSRLVENYEAIRDAPVFNVSEENQELLNVYSLYRAAVEASTERLAILYEECRTQHAGEAETTIHYGTGCDVSHDLVEACNLSRSAEGTLRQILGE